MIPPATPAEPASESGPAAWLHAAIVFYQFVQCHRTVAVQHTPSVQSPVKPGHEFINFIPADVKMSVNMIAAMAFSVPFCHREVAETDLPVIVNDPFHLLHGNKVFQSLRILDRQPVMVADN